MTDFRTYRFTDVENILIICAAVLAGIVIALLMYGNLLFSFVTVPLIPKIREIVREELCERRKTRYLNEFRDFLFMTSTSIGAGRSMKDAIGESIRPLRSIHGENSVLAGELVIVHERMDAGNENDVAVLMDLAELSGMEDVYDFVTIYSICKTTGASLIIALAKAASVIIDKMTIDREIRELVRRKKSEGLIIFVMPPAVILFLRLTAPDYIAPLYETLAGRLIMTAVIAATVLVYAMIQKIVKVDV